MGIVKKSFTEKKEIAPVAQLDRASDFGSEGSGFESLRAHNSQQSLAFISNFVHLEVADYPPQRILFNTLKYAFSFRSGG
jgi:hypothetical protein